MIHKTPQDSANTKKGGAPCKADKVIRVAIYLRKSVAFRWPRAKIEELIDSAENSAQVLPHTKPIATPTKAAATAPPVDKMAIARAALLGAEAKTGLSEATPLNAPTVRPFDTPELDAKMLELWYKIDKLGDRRALVHRFIELLQQEQCNTQAISTTLYTWQTQCEA
jgi:hypothetical protein